MRIEQGLQLLDEGELCPKRWLVRGKWSVLRSEAAPHFEGSEAFNALLKWLFVAQFQQSATEFVQMNKGLTLNFSCVSACKAPTCYSIGGNPGNRCCGVA